jgi:hypothetical protein
MNFFDQKDLGKHLLKLCSKVVKHSVYKNSVRTSQETHRSSTTNTSQLMLFREMVAVYCGNQMKHTNTVFWENPELRHVKACGTYKNHWALKG